jgi:hypothetical protein
MQALHPGYGDFWRHPKLCVSVWEFGVTEVVQVYVLDLPQSRKIEMRSVGIQRKGKAMGMGLGGPLLGRRALFTLDRDHGGHPVESPAYLNQQRR